MMSNIFYTYISFLINVLTCLVSTKRILQSYSQKPMQVHYYGTALKIICLFKSYPLFHIDNIFHIKDFIG
jgi:hypothetical protein